ncbi:MAG: ArdC-like ssDNA-binding domain-containing protein [Methylocella sp.]
MRTDVYQRITNQIVHELEQGIRPWMQPWSGEHAPGRITRPLRGNGIPYQGINILMLWGAAMEKGYSAPIWLTFKQAVRRVSRMKGVTHGSMSSVQLCRRFSHAGPVTARCEAGMKAQGDFQPSEETRQGEGRKGEANEPSVRRVVRNECRNVG